MSERVSIERDGAGRARAALEGCVTGGGVVLFPADGLYGLACDPLNATAIDRIQALKGRDDGKPSAVLYFSALMLRELVGPMGPRTRAAVGALLPGPVTVVVDNSERRYPLACRGTPERLGIRLVEGPLAGAPVVLFQTSANRSGQPATHRFTDLDQALVEGVDLAIDGGELGGDPSTVIDLSRLDRDGGWEVLREGAISAAVVERLMAGLPQRLST